MSFRRLFNSVETDVSSNDLEIISGDIPKWLSGVYIKNGPGAFCINKSKCDHWFDGLAYLSRIEIRDARVSYTGKYLKSEVYKTAKKKGRIAHSLFTFVPKMGPIKFLKELIYGRESGNNAAVNILRVDNRYFAITESIGLVEFDPQTLDTRDVYKFEDNIKGKITTAHPHVGENEYINFDVIPGRINQYQYYKVDTKSMERRPIGVIETQFLSYTHDFSVTDQYMVHVECPLIAFPASLPLRFGFFSYAKCYKWKPKFGTKFTVMNRITGEVVAVVKSRAILSLHHVNAFEDNGTVSVDLVAFDDDSAISGLYIDKMTSPDTRFISADARVIRFTIDINEQTISETPVSNDYVELPIINRKKYGYKDYSYIYGVGINPENKDEFDNAIVKVSTDTGNTEYWCEAGSYPGEPFFVEKPDATNEDDGVLVSIVSMPEKEKSYALILDAKSMSETCRIALPHMMPLGFHGNFYRD